MYKQRILSGVFTLTLLLALGSVQAADEAKTTSVETPQGNINITITNTNTNTNEAKSQSAAVAVSDEPPSRRHAIGIGTWGLSINNQDTDTDTTYGGGALTYQYGLNDHIALRVNLYSAKHEDFDDLTIGGLDGQLLLTTNARDNGFKFYVGGGYFSEKWKNDINNKEDSYNGGEVVFGLGYNFSRVGVDITGAVRPKSAYDADGANDPDLLFVTGSLRVTYRY